MRYIVAQVVDDEVVASVFDNIEDAVLVYVAADGLTEENVIFATEMDITLRANNSLIDFKPEEKTNDKSSSTDKVDKPGQVAV